ncbi:hypothetical protein B0F90DRAFT_1731097 [Multifurca ochricompacta]|uniref:Uncharacterized protein n=1 Tax=Multifurca ochricompacta TaxID=376703 RepID=A0AAD4M423_9AGAM|nr:hypothetical protein B0F90DRAFT_1731097 [Multifurca ochricompacta]
MNAERWLNSTLLYSILLYSTLLYSSGLNRLLSCRKFLGPLLGLVPEIQCSPILFTFFYKGEKK